MNKNEKLKEGNVKISDLYLDINNPRLSVTEPCGYDNVELLLDHGKQDELFNNIYNNFVSGKKTKNESTIEHSMLAQGWVPDAPPIVYKPNGENKYVVVEGNRRIATLKKLHQDFLKLKKTDEDYSSYERIYDQTQKIPVNIIEVKDTSELEEYLVHFLSVRHIVGVQEWSSHARNLFVVNLYRKFGGSDNDEYVNELVLEKVISKCGLSQVKARRVLQQAFMFEQFKKKHVKNLRGGDYFSDQDQQFFEQIISNRFLREDIFGLKINSLKMSDEAMLKLFNGSFYYDRKNGEKHADQIFHTAKSWKKLLHIHMFSDEQKMPSIKNLINLENPEESKTVRYVDNKINELRAKARPSVIIKELYDTYKEIPSDLLIEQGPILYNVTLELKEYLEMQLKLLQSFKDS